jgi:hypothetical protein
MYMTSSQSAFNAANKELTNLISLNVSNAREANKRAYATYRSAILLMILAMLVAGLMIVAAVFSVRRFFCNPLLDHSIYRHRLTDKETDSKIQAPL